MAARAAARRAGCAAWRCRRRVHAQHGAGSLAVDLGDPGSVGAPGRSRRRSARPAARSSSPTRTRGHTEPHGAPPASRGRRAAGRGLDPVLRRERPAHGGHRLERGRRVGQPVEDLADLRGRALVERLEGIDPGAGELHPLRAALALALQQPVALELGQQPAELSGVDVERRPQLSGLVAARAELEQHPRLGQRVVRAQVAPAGEPHPRRVEAVELADGFDVMCFGHLDSVSSGGVNRRRARCRRPGRESSAPEAGCGPPPRGPGELRAGRFQRSRGKMARSRVRGSAAGARASRTLAALGID